MNLKPVDDFVAKSYMDETIGKLRADSDANMAKSQAVVMAMRAQLSKLMDDLCASEANTILEKHKVAILKRENEEIRLQLELLPKGKDHAAN
jgi:hypothetical protein